MHYNKLGQTDIDVSVLALGCWPFAGGTTWGDQSDEDSIATVHAALDVGITFFDTAPGYGEGHSETVLSRGLEGTRQDAVIATKVSPQNLGAADLAKSCEQSLRDLDTDYIDLLQVHWPNHEVPLAETVSALERLKAEGKVRATGVCNFGVLDLGDLLELDHIETDQLPYSLLWRPIEYEVLPKCVENEVGVICYSPLSQGAAHRTLRLSRRIPSWLGPRAATSRQSGPSQSTESPAARRSCSRPSIACAESSMDWASRWPT